MQSSAACKCHRNQYSITNLRAATQCKQQYLIGPWCSSCSRTRCYPAGCQPIPRAPGPGPVAGFVALGVAATAATGGATCKYLFRGEGSLVDVAAHGPQHRGGGRGGAIPLLLLVLMVLWLGRVRRGRPGGPWGEVAVGASADDVQICFLEEFVRVLCAPRQWIAIVEGWPKTDAHRSQAKGAQLKVNVFSCREVNPMGSQRLYKFVAIPHWSLGGFPGLYIKAPYGGAFRRTGCLCTGTRTVPNRMNGNPDSAHRSQLCAVVSLRKGLNNRSGISRRRRQG